MDSFTLAVIGAAYGSSLAVGLSWRARRHRSAADARLASVLVCGIVAMVTIVAQHREDGGSVLLLETLEYAATLAVGPLLFLYMGAVRGRAAGRSNLLHFIPAAAVLALVPFGSRPLLGAPIELLLAHQFVYSCLAARRFFIGGAIGDHHRFWAAGALAVVGSTHLAQLVRIVWSASSRLENVVPVALAAGTLAIGAALVWLRPDAGRSRAARPSAGRSDSELAAIAARAIEAMERDHHYRNPDLSLHDLARIVGAAPHDLSRALNESLGQSLSTLLRRCRLEDARTRLDDPAHDLFSIEGIGQMSGFGSRSAFYEAFRSETGTTPALYRRSRSRRRQAVL